MEIRYSSGRECRNVSCLAEWLEINMKLFQYQPSTRYSVLIETVHHQELRDVMNFDLGCFRLFRLTPSACGRIFLAAKLPIQVI